MLPRSQTGVSSHLQTLSTQLKNSINQNSKCFPRCSQSNQNPTCFAQCWNWSVRERCMDLVSFETPEEYRHFALMLHRGERISLQYCWSAFLWSHSLCRQHQLNLDVWEEMQLQEQGLRRCPTSADQHQRMVCFTIFTILMILPTFPIDGWGLYQFHIGKHWWSMFIPCFRFWSDGNKRIPPTNIPSKLTFWSRFVPAKQTSSHLKVAFWGYLSILSNTCLGQVA